MQVFRAQLNIARCRYTYYIVDISKKNEIWDHSELAPTLWPATQKNTWEGKKKLCLSFYFANDALNFCIRNELCSRQIANKTK